MRLDTSLQSHLGACAFFGSVSSLFPLPGLSSQCLALGKDLVEHRLAGGKDSSSFFDRHYTKKARGVVGRLGGARHREMAGILTVFAVSLQNGGDGQEGSEPGTHAFLRRSQSYIPTSGCRPSTGPPLIKSGYCVKQGNVVSASTGAPLGF